MDTVINLYARLEGITEWVVDVLPLLGAIGGILGVISGVLIRAAGAKNPAETLHALHPTTNEIATFSLSLGVLRAHFKHNDNAKAIASLGSV